MHRFSTLGVLSVMLTIVFTVAGQLLVKKGMLGVGASPGQLGGFPGYLVRTLTNPFVFVGLGCAVVAALCWTSAVSRLDLSAAYPFMGLAIVLVLALSGVIFGETVPVTRWLGVAIVCLGLVVAAR